MDHLISPPTRALLALSMIKGVGPAALKKVAAIDGFCDKPIEALGRAVPPIARALVSHAAATWSKAKQDADAQLAMADRHRARILSPLDAEYPVLLAQTKDDPFLLFVKGSLTKNLAKSVAVIGTREPTVTGQAIAKRVASIFVEQGWSVVSGLAIGCDAIAHRAALDAGGHTVAVLAHGLQMIAPSRHKGLAEDILAAGGALVSEYPFGQGVQSQQYVKRDRTQAGMAQGVVMIQSDTKGGSLYASRAALDYDRWLAVPYPTLKDIERGEAKVLGNLLIADGSEEEKAALLRCRKESLDRVIILHERADILRLAGAQIEPSADAVDAALSEPLGAIEANQRIGQSGDFANETHPTYSGVEQRAPEQTTGAADHSSAGEEPVEVAVDTPALYPAAIVQVPDTPALTTPAKAESDSPYESGKSGATPSERSHPERRTRYYVALRDTRSLADLKIVQVPSSRLLKYRSDPQVSAHDVDVIVMLSSRLEHLQRRVDEVSLVHARMKYTIHMTKPPQLELFVEDVLTHMKRSVDDLARLKWAKDNHMAATVLATNRSTQLSLLEAKEVSDELSVDLAVALDQIVKFLPLSAAAPSGSKRSKTATRCELDVSLDDLVHSFNGLVHQVLDGNVSSDTRQLQDQTRQPH